MRIVKNGNSNARSWAYTSLMRPILEYGAACWDPYRECVTPGVQRKEAKIAHHRKDSKWETLAQRRKIRRVCAPFTAQTGELAWKAIDHRLQKPCYLSRVDNDRKITSWKQRTDIGKYLFVNRTIQLWNQLSADALGIVSCKPSHFRERVGEVINEIKWRCGEGESQCISPRRYEMVLY
jgi:hypothetical protein